MKAQDIKIAVIGLGYVGLPLARLFATQYPVVGFDINTQRVAKLQNGHDDTLEVSDELLQSVLVNKNPIANGQPFDSAQGKQPKANGLFCSSALEDIKAANFYIVSVPTPVDENHSPDLTPLIKASETIGKVLSKDDIVVYESTVYPGATEERCVPVLEQTSGMTFNEDFFVGYSPERINPGDKKHTVETILKVTSGSTPEIGKKVDQVYASVITAGTHLAPSIKVAEASKAIENAQRDVNISFVNELALIFDRIGIDTTDVIEAAGTKWNFLKFQPGLVGGHCIGVDPYYLAQKAKSLGYHPEVILSGRRVNDRMGAFVADKVVKLMIHKGINIKGAKVLILGVTFKENCPDIRNTKVVDVYKELKSFGTEVKVYDPWADPEEVKCAYDIPCSNQFQEADLANYDAVVLTVAHKEFLVYDYRSIQEHGGVVFDTKACLDRRFVDGRL